jgi:hypothetical protein
MYITYTIKWKNTISIAPVRSRGGSLVREIKECQKLSLTYNLYVATGKD